MELNDKGNFKKTKTLHLTIPSSSPCLLPSVELGPYFSQMTNNKDATSCFFICQTISHYYAYLMCALSVCLCWLVYRKMNKTVHAFEKFIIYLGEQTESTNTSFKHLLFFNLQIRIMYFPDRIISPHQLLYVRNVAQFLASYSIQ